MRPQIDGTEKITINASDMRSAPKSNGFAGNGQNRAGRNCRFGRRARSALFELGGLLNETKFSPIVLQHVSIPTSMNRPLEH
jgi:hypothetical protein